MPATRVLVPSPLGTLALVGSAGGVFAVEFVDNVEQADLPPLPDDTPAALRTCATQLDAYFAGDLTDFTVPLAVHGSLFERRVWRMLLSIPSGETWSYLELARALGDEKCIRAAGRANGKNPVAIIIPCHRVIGSDGSLTGYAGGLWRKAWLLNHEGHATQPFLFRE